MGENFNRARLFEGIARNARFSRGVKVAVLELVEPGAAVAVVMIPIRAANKAVVVVSSGERIGAVAAENRVAPVFSVEPNQLPPTHEAVGSGTSVDSLVRTILPGHDVVLLCAPS